VSVGPVQTIASMDANCYRGRRQLHVSSRVVGRFRNPNPPWAAASPSLRNSGFALCTVLYTTIEDDGCPELLRRATLVHFHPVSPISGSDLCTPGRSCCYVALLALSAVLLQCAYTASSLRCNRHLFPHWPWTSWDATSLLQPGPLL